MPAAGLTIGADSKLTFVDVNGINRFLLLSNFTFKEDANINKKVMMDGEVRLPKFHTGISGSFNIERSNNDTDAYFASQEAAYYLGGDQLPMTITQTITESNGTVSQYQFTNVVLVLENGGSYSGEESVSMSVSFMASRRKNMNQQAI